MARLTAPLFSLAASGTLANAITFSRWKGIAYARTRIIPANPRSAGQLDVRGIFSTLSEMWKRMPVIARQPFLFAVRGIAMTDRNKHVQLNVPALQGDANLNHLVMSVASGAAVPPATMTPSDAGGQVLTVALTAPTPPAGHTLSNMIAAAVLDGDPSPVLIRTTFVGVDPAAPYSIDLAVGVAGTYQVAGWCDWLRASDGLHFMSAALRDQQAIA